MRRERLIRGSLEEAASFDWYRAAVELKVPAERARALYDEAVARAAYPGSRPAQDLYLDWLEDEQPVRRLEPGKRTRTMQAAAAAGGWQRLPRLDDAPVDPGRRMRSSALDGRDALADRRLPAPVLEKMERAYGQRFDDVEVHADAAEVPAGQQAFTRGREIYLERGLELDSAHGEHVVAHELAHVAQQSRPASSEQGAAAAPGGARPASRAALEADAHQAALSALAGRAAMVQLSAPMHAALGFSNGGAHPAPSGGGSPQSAHGGSPAPAGGGSPGGGPRTTAPGAAPRPASSPAGGGAQPRPGATPRPAAPTATRGGAGTDGVLVPEAPHAMTPAAANRLQHVDGQNTQVATATTTLPSGEQQTNVARAAVVEPQAEQDARAQHDVVAAVDNRPPPSPEIVAACARIREVIRAKRPPDEDKLVEAKPKEMAQEAGNEMSSGVEQRTGTVRQGYADMQQQPQGQPTRPATPATLPPERAQTPPVDAAAGAPDPLHPHDVSLDSDVAAQQARIQGAGMNTPAGQLVQDGPIGDARGAAGELGDAARVDPQQVLANQAQAVAHAQTDMRALQAQAERALAEARAGTVAHIATHTTGVKTSEEEQRARAGAQMQAVFTSTQQSVDRLLQPLSANAVARWDAGVAQLSTAFESSLADVKRRIDERHKGDGSVLGDIGAGLTELGDDVFGLPDWVVEAYDRAEAAFADGSTSLLTDISRDVNVIIEDCKKLIEQARKDIEAIVHSLPQELQTWAQGEAARLNGQLDQLSQKVDTAQHGLNQDLIHRANSAVQQVREQVAALREKARGLIGKIADAIAAFLDDPAKAIINGLLSLLGIPPPSFWALVDKLGGVIDGIAADPMKFANTLMSGVGAGFQQFFHNLPTHLGQALFQWLFSKLGEAGVSMPTDFSLRSIITLVLEVLGISWAKVKLILARHIGEQNAELLDQAIQLITTLIEKGPQGLFDMLADQLNPSTIIDMIKDAALQYIMEAIVTRVAARILMMLNPAGAILQAIEAIYRVIKWVIDNAARIFTLIESVVNGAAQILAGNISGVANLVESSLVKLMVPVIDFLAGYLGLGGIPNAIKNLIMGLQARVEGILDRVIGFIVGKAKALWEAFKNRGKKKDGEHPDGQNPEGQNPDEVPVPTSIVEPRPATLDRITPELAAALAHTQSGAVIYQAGSTDPLQVTRTLIASHPDARYDRESRRLTLPPVSEGALAQAHSLQQLGQSIAQETGVSKVTITKSGDRFIVHGHINPETSLGTITVTEQTEAASQGFSMSGESHTLTASLHGTRLQITMASTPGELMAKAHAERQRQHEAHNEAAVRALDGFTATYSHRIQELEQSQLQEENKQRALEQLLRDMAADLTHIGTQFHIQDLGYGPLGLSDIEQNRLIYEALSIARAQVLETRADASQTTPSDEDDLSLRFDRMMHATTGSYAHACAARISQGADARSFRGNVFEFCSGSYFVDHDNNYIVPNGDVGANRAAFDGRMFVSSREHLSSRPAAGTDAVRESVIGAYAYTQHANTRSADFQRLARQAAFGVPIGTRAGAMFLAAMIAEAGRNPNAHITNMLLVNDGDDSRIFQQAPMTTGGTDSHDAPRDRTLHGLPQVVRLPPTEVTDREIQLVKSRFESHAGENMAAIVTAFGVNGAKHELVTFLVNAARLG